jgi:hypothetical protein
MSLINLEENLVKIENLKLNNSPNKTRNSKNSINTNNNYSNNNNENPILYEQWIH